MKLALLTDTHWGARNDSMAFIEFFDKFYTQVFIPKITEEQIDTVVMLGDTFDRRKYTNHVSLSHAKRIFFNPMGARGITIHMLIGNHDTAFKNTNAVNSPKLLLQEYDNLRIIESPQVMEFDGVPILMLPWICEENYDLSMKFIRESPVSLVMGHLEIAGFEMDKGLMCTEGLSASLFDRFELVMSGHFHHRSKRGPIQYLGNTYEITWADYDDPRGFHIFDTETRNLTFVPNPYKMFYKLYYDDATQDFEYWNALDYTAYKDTCVKVVVKQKQNPYLYDTMIDKLYAASPLDVSIVENHLMTTEHDVTNDAVIDQAQDTMSLLYTYIDGLKLNVDATQLKEFMNELYQDTLSEEQMP